MRNNLKNVQYLLFVLFILALTGCGASNLAGLGSNNEPGNITAKVVFEDGKNSAKSVGLVATGVSTVRFKVTGPYTDPVAKTPYTTTKASFPTAAGGGTVQVSPGAGLIVTVQALGENDALLYEGFARNVAVTSGATTNLGTITLTAPNVKSADAPCLGCHEDTRAADGNNLVAEYKGSAHYSSTVSPSTSYNGIVYADSVGCAGCHTQNHKDLDPAASGRCADCHNAAGTPPNFPHTQPGGSATPNFGNLSNMCSMCHNPHTGNTASSAASLTAQNIILIIGDGMQLEHERAGSNYLFGTPDSGLAFQNFPYKGQSTTWDVTTYNKYAFASYSTNSYSSKKFNPTTVNLDNTTTFDAKMGYDTAKGGKLPYPLDKTGDSAYLNKAATDSASAGTAMATGYKTDDGNIAWKSGDPENGRLLTIAEMYRYQKKAAIGVVSTVPFTHATPAAFVSHNKSRNNYKDIAYEIINVVKPDVVIGGGHPSYSTSYMDALEYTTLKNSTEYVLAERATGVDGNTTIAAKANEAVTGGKKLFGLFGNSGGQFDYPVPSNTPGSPSVTRGSTENPSLAEASKAALKVLSQNSNGFFLMIEQGDIDWANHANDFKSMVGGIYDLNETVKSVEAFVDQPGDSIDWNNTIVIVTSDHGNSYMRINPAKSLQKGQLPQQDANTTATGGYTPGFVYPNGEVSYASPNHTNELTRVYAKGAGTSLLAAAEGSWYASTNIIDNTQIFKAFLSLLGLADQNKQGSMASMVGRFATGIYGTGAAEIVAFHPSSKTIYTVNGSKNQLEILDASTLGTTALANPLTASNLTGTSLAFPTTVTAKVGGVNTSINIALATFPARGGGATSVATHGDLLAVAVANNTITDKGVVMFYNIAGANARNPVFIKAVQVGSLPDMVTFTPDGNKVVVANEGEPSDDYLTDPEGTVAIIDVTSGTPADTATLANFNAFDSQKASLAAAGVKFANTGVSSVSQDLEPEYIAISDDSKTAFVTLQENNAIAIVDLTTKTVSSVKPLGFKDYSLTKNALDISDKDGTAGAASVKFQTVTGLYGMYQPDTIATYTSGGATYIVTSNEGDAREYAGYTEQVRVKDIKAKLNPALLAAYNNAGGDNGLGRLRITNAIGFDSTGLLYDKLYSFGGRSFSIWKADGTLVYDSASTLERLTSAIFGSKFNTGHTSNKGDDRSDDKGPEPEALAVGQVGSKTYAFVGLERMGGFYIFDITTPTAPVFVEHVINRDLAATFAIDDTGANAHTGAFASAGDLGPEGMKFVSAASSPNGKALLIIGNEVSGTVSVYQINER